MPLEIIGKIFKRFQILLNLMQFIQIKSFYFILAFILIPAFINAQHTVWKITMDDKTHYIVPTCEGLDLNNDLSKEQLDQVYAKTSDVLLLEDPSIYKDFDKITRMLSAGRYTRGTSIQAMLSQETKMRLQDTYNNTEKLSYNERLKPYLHFKTFMRRFLNENNYEKSISYTYYLKCKASTKKIILLESVDSTLQLRYFEPQKDINEFVNYAIDAYKFILQNSTDTNMKDQAFYEKNILTTIKKYPNVHNRYIQNRINTFHTNFNKIINARSELMIILPSDIVYGSDGMLAKLKEKGINVEQMN